MLFELRTSVPEVSSAWRETRDLFLSGESRLALERAQRLRGKRQMRTANDFLLNIEIARACSLHKKYMSLVRLAMQEHSDDPFVGLYHARVLLTQSRQTEGIDFLKRSEGTLGQTHRAYWGTELANMYASAGFAKSSRHWMEQVAQESDFDAPLSLYTRSCADEGLQQWDGAVEKAEQCVAAAPDWSRARGYLVHCLLAKGKIAAAEEQIAEALRRGHEESTLDVVAAMLSLSQGHFEEARPRLEKLLEDWPQAEFAKWVRRTLCILLVELGEYEEARELTAGAEKEMALPEIPERKDGGHCCIPLPMIAQNRNQCVPTTVAMAVYPQGGRFDPDAMFREMHGREGTALWRMRLWCEQRGYDVVPVKLERPAVTAVLREGIPLIGSLEGPFNSHVDVVCGFNDDLETLYVRDPGHWALMAWPWEMALSRYRMHAGLLAVIERGNAERIVPEEWRSDECAALLDLSQAVANADREAAESAYARIADDSPASALRDGYGVNVAISPLQFRERMKRVSKDESADIVARFRAMISLGNYDDEVLDMLLDEDLANSFRIGGLRYLRLLKLMGDGDWQAAHRVIQQLLRRGCGIAQFWELKSDVLAALGEHEASQSALECAIELEPLRSSTREKALSRMADRLTMQEYESELNALLADDPNDKGLLLSRASLLIDGADGLQYEQAAHESIRWFPRLPIAYSNLLNWYLWQERRDLYDKLMDDVRRLLPDTFGETDNGESDSGESESSEGESGDSENGESSSELSSASNSREQPSESGRAATSDPELTPHAVSTGHHEGQAEASARSDGAETSKRNSTQDGELPEDKADLLDLVWQVDDPRREAALNAAIELQSNGRLQWYEVARLIACRLLIPDGADQELSEPGSLLPEPPPGSPVWFADALCDVLTTYDSPIATALAVDRWLVRVVPNYQDHSELWFKRVLVLEQTRQMELALNELLKLLERYPAMSSALYRMGVVKLRQQDYPSAQTHFEKALEVNPGLYGAMDGLRTVHETLERPREALSCTRMLRRKYPYSVAHLREEVLAVADLESIEAAEQILQDAANDFPERRVTHLKARLYLVGDRIDQAERLLADVQLDAADDDEAFEQCLNSKLRIALARQRSSEVISLCDSGIARWPDATGLKEIKAEQLGESDPAASRDLLREILIAGEPRPDTAWQFLQVAGPAPDQSARDLIQSAEPKRQEELTELFAEVMGAPELLAYNESLLTWAIREFPESNSIGYRLAMHYHVNGRAKAAIELAEQVFHRNPDSPGAKRLLGRCLMDRSASEALPYLEQVCEQNRSVDYLFDLARCCQLAGEQKRSHELHWEILEQNPYVSASWTNLFVFGASSERLWPYLTPMLGRGCGVDDEYFLVAAVMVAIQVRQRLPRSWLPLAVERWAVLQTHPGFRDERQRLKRALVAWSTKRADDLNPAMEVPGGFLERLKANFTWPGFRWIDSA